MVGADGRAVAFRGKIKLLNAQRSTFNERQGTVPLRPLLQNACGRADIRVLSARVKEDRTSRTAGTPALQAVLTGDIVGSSRFDPRDLKRVMQRIRQAGDEFAKAYPRLVQGKVDVFSGDGWQLLLADWRKAIRAAVFMRAVVKADAALKADTRVAIGVGSVDQATLNLKKISESTGAAFERSGRALKALKPPFRMTWNSDNGTADPSPLAVPDTNHRLFRGSVYLLDETIAGWKPGQAQTIAAALLTDRQQTIAKNLRVSQAAVSQALTSAGWKHLERYLTEVEI